MHACMNAGLLVIRSHALTAAVLACTLQSAAIKEVLEPELLYGAKSFYPEDQTWKLAAALYHGFSSYNELLQTIPNAGPPTVKQARILSK